MIIELGEWLPDVPTIDNPGMIRCRNLVPTGDGAYMKVRDHLDSGEMPAGTDNALLGGFSSIDNGVIEDFCGDSDNLYRLTWNGTDITAANASSVADSYTVTAGNFWDFAQFGSKIIAVNGGESGSDTPQTLTLGGANFADLAGSPPNAKTCDVVRDFVVFGHTYDATDGERESRIWWSAFADETDWTPSAATQCDFQDLMASAGEVQRVCGGEDAIIVTRRSVYLMTYVGPPTAFRFDEVGAGRARGTPYPHSVIRDGDTVYYWSDIGPIACTKEGVVTYLALNKCQEFYRDNFSAAVYEPVAYRDPQYGAICWSFGSGSLPDLYYFPSMSRFTEVSEVTPVNLGYIWGSRLTQSNSTIQEAPIFKESGGLTLFSRSHPTETMLSDFKTGAIQLFEGRRSLVKEARTIWNTNGADQIETFAVVSVNSSGAAADNAFDDVDYTNTFSQNALASDAFHGFSEGRYHSFRVTHTNFGSATTCLIRGIEIEPDGATSTGKY